MGASRPSRKDFRKYLGDIFWRRFFPMRRTFLSGKNHIWKKRGWRALRLRKTERELIANFFDEELTENNIKFTKGRFGKPPFARRITSNKKEEGFNLPQIPQSIITSLPSLVIPKLSSLRSEIWYFSMIAANLPLLFLRYSVLERFSFVVFQCLWKSGKVQK